MIIFMILVISCNQLFFTAYFEPNRIIERKKPSFIDKVFLNICICTKKLLAGNLVDIINGHVSDFFIIQNMAEEQLREKTQIQET